jgi:hypothetical protein
VVAKPTTRTMEQVMPTTTAGRRWLAWTTFCPMNTCFYDFYVWRTIYIWLIVFCVLPISLTLSCTEKSENIIVKSLSPTKNRVQFLHLFISFECLQTDFPQNPDESSKSIFIFSLFSCWPFLKNEWRYVQWVLYRMYFFSLLESLAALNESASRSANILWIVYYFNLLKKITIFIQLSTQHRQNEMNTINQSISFGSWSFYPTTTSSLLLALYLSLRCALDPIAVVRNAGCCI